MPWSGGQTWLDLGKGVVENTTGVIGVTDTTVRAGLQPFAGTIIQENVHNLNLEGDRSR